VIFKLFGCLVNFVWLLAYAVRLQLCCVAHFGVRGYLPHPQILADNMLRAEKWNAKVREIDYLSTIIIQFVWVLKWI
jgi:hypothetical protein